MGYLVKPWVKHVVGRETPIVLPDCFASPCYDVLFMNRTVDSQPKPVDEQGMNVMVGTVARLTISHFV